MKRVLCVKSYGGRIRSVETRNSDHSHDQGRREAYWGSADDKSGIKHVIGPGI